VSNTQIHRHTHTDSALHMCIAISRISTLRACMRCGLINIHETQNATGDSPESRCDLWRLYRYQDSAGCLWSAYSSTQHSTHLPGVLYRGSSRPSSCQFEPRVSPEVSSPLATGCFPSSSPFGDLQSAVQSYGAFWLFAGVCLSGVAFVYFYVPKDEGKITGTN